MDWIPGILAITFLLSGFWTFFTARKAASWPNIEAVVVRSDIVPTPEDDAIGARFEIAYQYRIQNVTYTSERLSFAPTSVYPGYCQKMANKYPVGSKISIFYDPLKPSVSTIYANKTDSGSILFILVGLIMGIAALVIHDKDFQKIFMTFVELIH